MHGPSCSGRRKCVYAVLMKSWECESEQSSHENSHRKQSGQMVSEGDFRRHNNDNADISNKSNPNVRLSRGKQRRATGTCLFLQRPAAAERPFHRIFNAVECLRQSVSEPASFHIAFHL